MNSENKPTPHPHAKLIMQYATELAAGRIKHWKVEYKSSEGVRYAISTNPAWHEDAEYKLIMQPTHPDYKPPVVKQVFNGQEFEFDMAWNSSMPVVNIRFKSVADADADRFYKAIK